MPRERLTLGKNALAFYDWWGDNSMRQMPRHDWREKRASAKNVAKISERAMSPWQRFRITLGKGGVGRERWWLKMTIQRTIPGIEKQTYRNDNINVMTQRKWHKWIRKMMSERNMHKSSSHPPRDLPAGKSQKTGRFKFSTHAQKQKN